MQFLDTADAERMQQIAESFGSFGTYADEATSEGLGEKLPQHGVLAGASPDPDEFALMMVRAFVRFPGSS